MNDAAYTAFLDQRFLASGPAADVGLAVRAVPDAERRKVLIFDDRSGRSVDFDLRGSEEEVLARLSVEQEPPVKRSRGRPKLGVVAREVTLLPRHWEWLSGQPGGASVALRKLVEESRRQDAEPQRVRQAQAAADRFMLAMLGDQPGYEDATRALYAGDHQRFDALIEAWPEALRDHAHQLAAPAFAVS